MHELGIKLLTIHLRGPGLLLLRSTHCLSNTNYVILALLKIKKFWY